MHTLIFALVLSLVCSALLAAVSWHAQPLYKINQELERKRKTLNVFNVEIPEAADTESIEALYEKNIQEVTNDQGAVTAYRYLDPASGEVAGIGFPANGKGLWGPIRGMIAMKPDLKTLMGVRFLEHVETPGLGAEIEKPWFEKQFVNTPAVGEDGEVKIVVLKSSETADEPYEIDGISGATLTGNGVTEMLQREIKNFRERYQSND